MPEVIDECYGCVHSEPIIENTLQYCSRCVRGTGNELDEDLYVNRHEKRKEE